MSDWIELKCIKERDVQGSSPKLIEPMSLRAYTIQVVAKWGSEACQISLDDEKQTILYIAEPYEDVMAKIKEVEEPVDLSNCVVEHFTRDEYELIKRACDAYAEVNFNSVDEQPSRDIVNKVKEILKEDK